MMRPGFAQTPTLPTPLFPALSLSALACSSAETRLRDGPRPRAPAALAVCFAPETHALVSSDDEVWLRSTLCDSRDRVSAPSHPIPRDAVADGGFSAKTPAWRTARWPPVCMVPSRLNVHL